MSGRMSLLDAFRQVGPCLGPPDVDSVREAAAERLLEEMRRVGAAMPFKRQDLDDVTQDVLWRLIRVGPRGMRTTDPDTEEGVQRFLARSLRNAALDISRRDRRVDLEPDPGQRSGGLEGMSAAEARERKLAEVRRLLWREIVEPAARALHDEKARQTFLQAIEELRTLADGRISLADLLEREQGATNPRASARTARNRLDQRYSRALRRVAETIDARARMLTEALESVKRACGLGEPGPPRSEEDERQLAEARAILWQAIAESVANTADEESARRVFIQVIGELRTIADGRASLERDRVATKSRVPDTTATERLERYRDALRRLDEEIAAWARRLQEAMESLRLRQNRVPRRRQLEGP